MANKKTELENLAQLVCNEVKASLGDEAHLLDIHFLNRIRLLLAKSSGFTDADVESKSVTILLSDIRGFTAIAETYSALTVVDMLNRYFAKMCEVVVRYGGTIDKFMGDSIMVLFGAPVSREDDVERALACAVEMQLAMSEINEHNIAMSMPPLYMGIGINTGTVVAGPLGSEIHSEYTVIGDQVNLASRIEAQSLRGQILISENTYRVAMDFIEVGEPCAVQVKGRKDPVFLYELLATRRPRVMSVPRREDRKSPRVEVRLPLTFQKLRDKEVLPEKYRGQIVDLGYNGMLALSPIYLEPFTEIRMAMATCLLGEDSTDIYARILQCERADNYFRCSMEFTSINELGQSVIKSFVDRLVYNS
jgi:adenylate cyclase